ncbi:MAG: hypothetical protein KA444_09915 [Bacteroidia bacterium]|nr:hypothetical protein [Bacteroidia bacterium]
MRKSKNNIGRFFLSVLLIIFSLSFTSCDYFRKKSVKDEGTRVARAYGYILYEEDLSGIVPQGVIGEDSIAVTANFIENWIRQKAVLHKAESNLDEEKKDVERKLEEYRNSLITYTYETELVKQKLDTAVSEAEFQEYYDNNKNNFELKDNIIKVIYLKLNKKSPKLNKVRDWYKSSSVKDRNLLQEYCHQYALNYFLDDSTWLLFDDLLKEIPIKTYDKEQYLQNNRNIEIEDSSNIYLVSIKGFMMKNTISPLSFERNNIRNLIINQRKLALVEKMEREAYEDAKKGGDVEVY